MITTIIVNYQDHQLTSRAVASVLADQPDAQVIVVDNSENETESQALRLLLPPQVECIVTSENIGFGRACNLGYGKARYQWILLLNPDAFVLKGCIGTLVDFLQKTPQAGAVAPLAYWDEAQKWLLPPGQLPRQFTELGMALALCSSWLGNKVSLGFRCWALRCLNSSGACEQRMLSGGHMLLRQATVEAAGGLFDPAFFMYYEDADLCRRIRSVGYKLFFLPSATVVHEWRAAESKTKLAEESRQHYVARHFRRGIFYFLSRVLDSVKMPISLPTSCDLGVCNHPPLLQISRELQPSWLLELSPHPLCVPAVYHWGVGETFQLGASLWERLGPGEYWMRMSAPGSSISQRFRWRIER
ncbi:MAG: glycosyltransferase family 2 protein [Deltaproteobacteria bacterium]|nr:glycosyltransferase family 2 protein [Deltaproteobacteria bacterium]